MSHMDDFDKGVKPNIEELKDEELDDVSGGITNMQEEIARSAAKAEGRTIQLDSMNGTCIHNHKYKFASRKEKKFAGIKYYNVKCYKCGKTWDDALAFKYFGDKEE